METPPQYDPDTFTGFTDPTQNWSRLPHQLIAALPLIDTLGEMKVILYVLRHTWGYDDEEKRISLDEFQNGRKHSRRYIKKHPDESERLDNGVGMAINSIKLGIERAVKHGFLEVDEDASDKARIERWYSLRRFENQNLTAGVSETDTQKSEPDTRTLKEPKREPKKEKTPDGDSLFFGPDGPPEHKTIKAELPRTSDPLVLAGHSAKKRAQVAHPDFTDASKDGSNWVEPVRSFCTLTGKEYATMTRSTAIKLIGIFAQVGAATNTTAPEVADAIGRFKEAYPWWNDDWPSDGFCSRLGMLLTPDAEPTIANLGNQGYRTDAPAAL